jgi:hypothetical protein
MNENRGAKKVDAGSETPPAQGEEAEEMAALTGHLRRNLVAYLALFVALSSTSFAAATKLLPQNSVGTRQVINGSLQRVDLSRRAVKALRGLRGPVGPVGPVGPQGPQGPAGGFTTGNVSIVNGPVAYLCPVQGGDCRFNTSSATCPPGKVAIAGGWHYLVGPADLDTSVNSNTPFHITGGIDGWGVGMRNNSDMPWWFYAIVICAG